MSQNEPKSESKTTTDVPHQQTEEKNKHRSLYDKYRKDLDISQFIVKKAINSVDNWVLDVENHRNYKMESEFNKEKEFKIAEQNSIKNQIEELSNNSENELQIQYFNSKISQQENLYNNYNDKNEEILSIIKNLKDNIPAFESSVNEYKEEL